MCMQYMCYTDPPTSRLVLLLCSVSSGAQIKIAGNEGGDSTDRLVTITGTPEAVGVAQYLISSR